MNKKNVIIVMILIVVAIVIAIVAGYFTFKLIRKEDRNIDNPENNVATEAGMIKNETIENKLENTSVIENKVNEETNTTITEPNTGTAVVPSSVIYETNPDAAATDKKQEAIELVKKEWGEDSTVSFRCDHVTENGEYRIAVISKETASVKNYFTVNLQNKTVEVEY